MLLKIVIPGKPVAWARTTQDRYSGRRIEAKGPRSWKGLAVPYFERAMHDAGHAAPFAGDLKLLVRAWFKRPGKPLKRSSPPAEWHSKNPDASNVLKLVEDAANGVLWLDDRQLVRVICEKRTCPQADNRPRVEVFVAYMEDPA